MLLLQPCFTNNNTILISIFQLLLEGMWTTYLNQNNNQDLVIAESMHQSWHKLLPEPKPIQIGLLFHGKSQDGVRLT